MRSLNILSCGAGQQSTALCLMSVENSLCQKLGRDIPFPLVPVYDAVVFCDLGGEPEWVYRQVDFLFDKCSAVGMPFYILKDKNLYEDFLNNYGKRRVTLIPFWSLDENGKPGRMRRTCTIDYKILQIQNFIRWEILGYKKGERTRKEDVGNHFLHIGFTEEERDRIFESRHVLFVNKFPMVEMGLTRADNFAYVAERWGLLTKASACLFCPFHTNYYYGDYCKNHCQDDYEKILRFDKVLASAKPDPRIGVPNSQCFITKARKRVVDLVPEDCCDKQTFDYNGEEVWNGF